MGRRTLRLNDALQLIGFALGSEAGARLACQPGMPVSPETLLRRVRQHHFPDHPIPRVVGVDDWAFHKGQRYRILLVDLERHKPIMYITETIRPGPNGTSYHCVLLRQSYREEGKVKNRTIANLSHCTPQEVEAIRLALQHKDDLAVLSTCPPVSGSTSSVDANGSHSSSQHHRRSADAFSLGWGSRLS